jgi:hypothetical protein
MSFLLIPLFAFFYRCRGGFLGFGHTQLARLVFWVLPVTLWAATVSLVLAPACGVLSFLGLMIPHGWAQGDKKIEHLIGMGGIGICRLGLILAPLAYINPQIEILAVLGAWQGAAYYFGWELDGTDSGIKTAGFKVFGFDVQPGIFAKSGTEWGEVLTGAAFGLAFALTYLVVN